jgi:hypothetical protein
MFKVGIRDAEHYSGAENAVHPSTKLRTNGGWIEIIGEFPFALRLSKHEVAFSATC